MSTDETPGPTFAELGMDERVLRALTDVGYETPSSIQSATIPPLLEGRDVVGLAQTGTGKTAAFAVPILSRIDLSAKGPQALVLAPTRELALQVAEAFGRYAVHLPGVQVLPIYGGQGYGPQLAALRRGVHVVVGTPGRVIDHLDKGTLQLGHLTHLVLDEADEMLRMGFAEDVERILADTPDSKQVALFSATMPPQIRRLSKQYLHDPVEILVKTSTVTAANTRQRYVQVAGRNKVDALTRVLEVEAFEAMIIFVRTKQATQELADKLKGARVLGRRHQRRHDSGAARADRQRAQGGRPRHPGRHRRRRPRPRRRPDQPRRQLRHPAGPGVLRPPHRTYGTRRAFRRGTAAGHPAGAAPAPLDREGDAPAADPDADAVVEDVNSTRIAKFRDRITSSLASDEMGLFRKLVADYEQEHDVPAIDIAPRSPPSWSTTVPSCCSPRPRSASASGSRQATRAVRVRRAPARDAPPARRAGPRPATRWRRTGSGSASGTRRRRARSSARSPTRAG
jgi:ATP-dependent RNA helicase DeaD